MLIDGNTGASPLNLAAALQLNSNLDYRGRGTLYTASDDDDWFLGVPYTGAGFTLGRHATQPEYDANSLIFVQEDGDVGLGTNNPSFGLDVQIGNNDGVAARFEGTIQVNQTDATSRAYGFLSTDDGSTMIGGNLRKDDGATGGTHDDYSKGTNARGGAGILFNNSSSGSGTFQFMSASDTDDDTYTVSEFMRIDASGNVGIGTTSPSKTLSIEGDDGYSSGEHILVNFSRTTPTTGVGGVYVGYFADGSDETGGIIRSMGGLPLYLGTYDSKQLLTIGQSDNVGIGTTSPDLKLDVEGDIKIGGSNNELRFYEGSNYVGFEAPALSADQIWVLPTADGTNGQVIQTNGSGTLSWTTISTGASAIDDLSDAKSGGSNFTNSILIGHETTGTLSSADENVGVGIGTLSSITSGTRSTAVGYNSLQANTTGEYNIAYGYFSMYSNIDGKFNNAVGNSSLYSNTSGRYNTSMGHKALFPIQLLIIILLLELRLFMMPIELQIPMVTTLPLVILLVIQALMILQREIKIH